MKLKYTNPEMEIVQFECEDVITTSGFEVAYASNELPLVEPGYIGAIDNKQWS